MQPTYYCPSCKSIVAYGAANCQYCGCQLVWQQQPQPQPPVQSYDTSGQKQNYTIRVTSQNQNVTSVCVKCQNQNSHQVDHNGDATVTCSSCSTVYDVKTYQVRAKGGRRDRKSGVKHYSVRVKEPDRDETLLEFDSKQDIEMRSGDWITGSYKNGKLKYLLNQTIHNYWDVQSGMGCFSVVLILVCFIVIATTLLVTEILFASG